MLWNHAALRTVVSNASLSVQSLLETIPLSLENCFSFHSSYAVLEGTAMFLPGITYLTTADGSGVHRLSKMGNSK